MAELTIFKRPDYQSLKTKIEADGKKLISVGTVIDIFNYGNISERIGLLDLSEVVIDISALKNIEIVGGNFLLAFEYFVEEYLSEACFATDYDTQEFREKVSYIFEKIRVYENPKTRKEIKEEKTQMRIKKKIVDCSREDIEKLVFNFSNKIIGHDRFKDELLSKLIEFKIFNSMDENKIYSFFIMGESGVGKTEVAKVLHQLLGGETPLAKINFGNYSSQDALNSLIGSPRGYIGSETGELFERVEQSNTGIILIDEFEKATTSLFNYFLEVLESGVAINSQGEILDLNGYIFIFTSNIEPNKFEEVFSPELRSRFNYICSFSPLSYQDKENYLFTRFSKYVDEFNNAYNKKLKKLTTLELKQRIDINMYDNMRVLNSEIRNLFISYINEKYEDKKDKIWG